MKLNSLTPALKNDINPEILVKKAQDIAQNVTSSFLETRTMPKVSIARVNLELNAESMSPQEYIAARSYIAGLEMDELIASEMKMLK